MFNNLRKIFKMRKTKPLSEESLDIVQEKDVYLDNNSANNMINNKEIEENDDENIERNIVRTRLNAYVIKNKEEDFRMMEYDINSGEVLWIEGKLFNNLRGLDRVRWSPNAGSATVFYGYISEEDSGDKLVSSVYIMRTIDKLRKKDQLREIVYNIKNSTVTIYTKNKSEDKPKVFYLYSVCGLVEIERELGKVGLTLNKI